MFENVAVGMSKNRAIGQHKVSSRGSFRLVGFSLK